MKGVCREIPTSGSGRSFSRHDLNGIPLRKPFFHTPAQERVRKRQGERSTRNWVGDRPASGEALAFQRRLTQPACQEGRRRSIGPGGKRTGAPITGPRSTTAVHPERNPPAPFAPPRATTPQLAPNGRALCGHPTGKHPSDTVLSYSSSTGAYSPNARSLPHPQHHPDPVAESTTVIAGHRCEPITTNAW